MNKNGQENILVIGPAWIGDMVMAQSLFISLKEAYEDCRLSVMAPAWTRPLVERMPEVDTSFDLPIKHNELNLRSRRSLGKMLATESFTRAIVLPNSFKSALIPFYAGIAKRIGWRGEWRNLLLTDCRRLDKNKFPLMVQRFNALAFPESSLPPRNSPPPRLAVDPEKVAVTLADFHLDGSARNLAICPGAEFGASKQWPAEHYAEASRALIAEGWTVWIFGSASDEHVAESIMAGLDSDKRQSCINLAGRTSLAQAIDLMSSTQAVIANDSGLMHIAAALDKPVVALYGSTSPDFTPPLADNVKLLFTDIECRPCFKRDCPYGHLRCLKELEPIRAIRAVQELTGAYQN